MNMLHIRFPKTFIKPVFNHVLLLAKTFEDTENFIHTTTIDENGLVLKLDICGSMNVRSALSRAGVSIISVRGKKFLKIEDGLSREYNYLPVEGISLNGFSDVKHILTPATFKEKVFGVFGLIPVLKPIKLNSPSVMVIEMKKDDIPEELKALINAVKEEGTSNDFYSRPTEDELHGDEIKNTIFDHKPEPRKFMDSAAHVYRTRVEASFDNNGDEIKNTTFDSPKSLAVVTDKVAAKFEAEKEKEKEKGEMQHTAVPEKPSKGNPEADAIPSIYETNTTTVTDRTIDVIFNEDNVVLQKSGVKTEFRVVRLYGGKGFFALCGDQNAISGYSDKDLIEFSDAIKRGDYASYGSKVDLVKIDEEGETMLMVKTGKSVNLRTVLGNTLNGIMNSSN